MNGEPALQLWHDYAVLGGTAAATLLGLLFIAVTLNADLILASERPHTKHVAEQAFQNYIAVLVTSLLLVFPGLSQHNLAVSLLGVGAGMIAWVGFRLTKTRGATDAGFGRARVWRRLLPSLLAYGRWSLEQVSLLEASRQGTFV